MRLHQILVAGLGLGLSFGSLVKAADKKYASVEVTVDEKAADKAKGIRTLYLIVYDNKSPMPMPYGAMKVDLKADVKKGTVWKGDLTTANVQVMNPSNPFPADTIKLKARLDKDGSAGMDQPEDVAAKVDSVKVGDTVKISITL